MKKKLIVVLFLTTLLLTGIIAVQAYWSFSAYKLNKQRFNGDVDLIMQRALDSCKKDYFDSIRVVIVKRLSSPDTRIKIDTDRSQTASYIGLQISINNKYTGLGKPYGTTVPVYNFYRKKIAHEATVPEVLTEMSFYEPNLRDQLLLLLGMEDAMKDLDNKSVVHSGVFQFPNNFRRADSAKLYKYYRAELNKLHPMANFDLQFSEKPIPATQTEVPKPFTALWGPVNQSTTGEPVKAAHENELLYSETNQYAYKYHGFLFLQHTDKNTLFVRAIFDRAQVGVLKEMILPLLLSGLLILFTIFCFYYIIRTIIRQKKLTELKDDFINNMTHELKTPIATITVAIEGMQKYNALNDPEKTQRYLQNSRNELGRLNDLVTKVLNIAAFEGNEITLSLERIDVNGLINDLINSEAIRADKDVTINFRNDGVNYITADRTHLRNVLANLIDNAVKYSGEPVIVDLSVSKAGNRAMFIVRDNGSGIPAAHLNRIFDKFHRVPTGNVHNVKGTGLGLYYVKCIVEAHHGEVAVKSVPAAGSEFIITLPLGNE